MHKATTYNIFMLPYAPNTPYSIIGNTLFQLHTRMFLRINIGFHIYIDTHRDNEINENPYNCFMFSIPYRKLGKEIGCKYHVSDMTCGWLYTFE